MKYRKLFVLCAFALMGAAAAWAAGNEGVLGLMRDRCSVRDYQQKPVADEALKMILEAGRLAPTNHNRQPVRVFAVRTPKTVEEVHKLEKSTFNAPELLIVGYDPARCKRPPREGETAATIAATMMMVQAQSLGVGTLWTSPHKKDELRALCAIPEGVEMTSILLLGYPAEGFKPAPSHFERKPMEEFAEYR